MSRSPSGYKVHDWIVSDSTECILAAIGVKSNGESNDEKQKMYELRSKALIWERHGCY